MNKKTMAILLASAVAAAGVIGLTACSDNGGAPKGEKVTEEQWKAAITATVNAESYTVSVNNESKESASGEVDGKTVNYVGTYTSTGKLYYDLSGKKVLSETTESYKTTGAELFDEEDEEETSERKSYTEADGLTIWSAYLYDNQTEWSVYSRTCSSESELKETFTGYGVAYVLANSKFSTTEDGEGAVVSELYSAFTYNNGVYTATLYSYGSKADVTISVKGGYVIGIMSESTEEDTDDNIAVKSNSKIVYTLSDFGKTTVTTPEDAASAIAAEKAENN